MHRIELGLKHPSHTKEQNLTPIKRLFINLLFFVSFAAQANEAILERVARIHKLLEKSEQTLIYPRGAKASLIKAQTPDEILIACTNLAEKIYKVGNPSQELDQQIQSALLEALKALVVGKPATFSNNKKQLGWFLGNTDSQGQTGETQLRAILELNILKENTKSDFFKFAHSYDSKNPQIRDAAGFKPDFNGYLNNFESVIERLGKNSTPAQNSTNTNSQSAAARVGSNRQSFDEILQQSLGRQVDLEKFKQTLQIKKNIYNDQLSNKIEFYGRQKEIQQAKTKLSLVNKGHLFFTGKAGVGKSTLVEMLQLDALKDSTNSKPPIFLELSITLLTNDRDPTALTKAIEAAELLAQKSGRKIVLFIDESHVASPLSQNALKSALASLAKPQEGHVHFIFACTGDDSAQIFRDVAFARRWNEIYVPEFTFAEAKASIKKTFIPLWAQAHPGFQNISDAAFEFAEEYSAMEQPFAGRPTNIKELLEAAIAHKFNNDNDGNGVIEPQDIRNYLRNDKGVVLFPGDPDFNNQFNKLWARFESLYPADPGFLDEIRNDLRFYFLNKDPDKVPSWIFMGPPGAGKSYLYDVISQVFFNTEPEVINTSELGSGGMAINKLIGSVAGTKDSKEAGILVKAIKKMPQGGPIVFEEADYLSPDLLKFLVNTITSKKFRDGMGNEYDISKFIFVLVTNQGQEIALPPGGTMTWSRYNEILNSITEPWQSADKSQSGRVVKKQIKADSLDKYLYRVFGRTAEAKKDTSAIEEDAAKFRRRLVPKYLFGPEKTSLEKAFAYNVQKIKSKFAKIYGIDFTLTPVAAEKILDLDNFNFAFGYAYAKDRATQFIDLPLNLLLSETHSINTTPGTKLIIDVTPNSAQAFGFRIVTEQGVLLKEFPLTSSKTSQTFNIWAQSDFINRAFAHANQLNAVDNHLAHIVSANIRAKSANPKHSFTLTWLGSKKEAFTAAQNLAAGIYNDSEAFYSFSRLLNAFSLGDYIRPPGGIRNAEKETPFEKWLLSRINIGGVVLLDGLLDFEGLSQDQIAQKISVLSQLENMLSQNRLDIAGQSLDLSAFVFVVSGSPYTNSTELSKPESIARLQSLGLNLDKIKSLGSLYIHRHTTSPDTLAQDFLDHVNKQFFDLGSRSQIRIPRDELDIFISKIKQSSSQNEFNLDHLKLVGIDSFVYETGAQIENALRLSALDQISFTFSKDGAIIWLVNEEPVVFTDSKWSYLKSLQHKNLESLVDLSPQLSSLLNNSSKQCRPSLVHLIKFLGE
jgi:DNA replication protein DnaC